MAHIPIEIIDLRKEKTTHLQDALALANACQEEFLFLDASEQFTPELKLHIKSEVYSVKFFDAVDSVRKRLKGYHPFIFLFIDAPLRSEEWSNLFSTRRTESGFVVATTADVVEVIIQPHQLTAYFLYEFAVHSLAMVVGGREHHQERRGCIFDFKAIKNDILISMESGLLCDECKEWLLTNGHQLSPKQLLAIETLLAETSRMLKPALSASAPKPRIFLGSSTEGLSVAREIQAELQHDYHVEIWNQDTVFALGTVTIEALGRALDSYALGLFLFTPDDKTVVRATQTERARDNVVFEAGLFIGRLGRFRVFVIHPSRGIALPSDLHGLTTATYDASAPNKRAAVGPACEAIRKATNAAIAAQRRA